MIHSNTHVVQFILRAVRLTFNMVWSYKNMLHHRVEPRGKIKKYFLGGGNTIFPTSLRSKVQLRSAIQSSIFIFTIFWLCSDLLNVQLHSQGSTFYIDKQKLHWFHITRCSSAKVIVNDNKNSQMNIFFSHKSIKRVILSKGSACIATSSLQKNI